MNLRCGMRTDCPVRITALGLVARFVTFCFGQKSRQDVSTLRVFRSGEELRPYLLHGAEDDEAWPHAGHKRTNTPSCHPRFRAFSPPCSSSLTITACCPSRKERRLDEVLLNNTCLCGSREWNIDNNCAWYSTTTFPKIIWTCRSGPRNDQCSHKTFT